MRLSPTLACADCLRLASDLDALTMGGADRWHIDIMDGQYVPNLCLSFDQAAAIKRYAPQVPMDVHLMVAHPFGWLDALARLKPEYAAVHLDATPFVLRYLDSLRKLGIHPGVAINPSQPIALLEEVLPAADYVLLMAVEPGLSGQSLLRGAYDRLAQLTERRQARHLTFDIVVDGGVSHENAPLLVRQGADILVGGAFACFGQPDGISASCRRLKAACADGA